MSNDMGFAKTDIYSTDTVYPPSQLRRRSLGGAILLAAVDDYRSMDECVHKDAEQFLYPQTPEWQEQYDWAVSLADGLNPAWLRDALDKFKPKWDGQRFERKALSRRAFDKQLQLDRGNRRDEDQSSERIHSDGSQVSYWHA